jgi:hypothetical protein
MTKALRTARVVFAVFSLCFIALLLAEGAWSVAHLGIPHRALVSYVLPEREPEPVPGEPAAALVRNEAELEALIDELVSDGVGLGNTPFEELETKRAKVNTRVDGCRQQKPNQRKTMVHIRTHLYEPFDPVTAFWNTGNELSPAVRAFIDKYGFHRISHTTNEFGERTTHPWVEADQIVLVAGDSVAAGTMVDDTETIASQMQARDGSRRYVNLGINAAHAKDVKCALERAAQRYAGRIGALYYFYSENDFIPEEPLGKPEEVIDFLRGYVSEQKIDAVTVAYSPLIYNIVPQITRFRGSRGDRFPHHGQEKQRLRQAVAAAGFTWIDCGDIALEANREAGTQFAALALFVDHAHYSREGIRRLVDRLMSKEN